MMRFYTADKGDWVVDLYHDWFSTPRASCKGTARMMELHIYSA